MEQNPSPLIHTSLAGRGGRSLCVGLTRKVAACRADKGGAATRCAPPAPTQWRQGAARNPTPSQRRHGGRTMHTAVQYIEAVSGPMGALGVPWLTYGPGGQVPVHVALTLLR